MKIKSTSNYIELTKQALAIGKVYHFIIPGRPRCQKNDLMIYWTGGGRFKGGKPFIAHSGEFNKFRDGLSDQIYGQYVSQGGKMPIEYLFELDMKFYIQKKWEGDLDNMPAALLDAMQGHKITGGFIVSRTITNDKLLRKLTAEKIMQEEPTYSGDPRIEFTLKPYDLGKEETK